MAKRPLPLLESGTFGGYMPPEERFTELPDLVLYPDGTLLVTRKPAWIRPTLYRRRLTPEQVREVVEPLWELLTGLRESYLWDEAVDAGTSHIRLHGQGGHLDAGVYAFRIEERWPVRDHPDRADLERFAMAWDRLEALAEGPGDEYVPERLAVFAAVEPVGEPPPGVRRSLSPGDLDLWPVVVKDWAPPLLQTRVKGKTAAWVYALLSRSEPGQLFSWGNLLTRLAYRPVLPHER